MALTTQGHFMINDDIQEYVAKSLKVNYESLSGEDSGRTDDGVYHYNYIYNRGRKITIQLVPTTQQTVAALLNAVAGKTYNLTYYDPIAGEKTIQAHTKSTSGSSYSGVLINGSRRGLSFKAEQIGGETV